MSRLRVHNGIIEIDGTEMTLHGVEKTAASQLPKVRDELLRAVAIAKLQRSIIEDIVRTANTKGVTSNEAGDRSSN